MARKATDEQNTALATVSVPPSLFDTEGTKKLAKPVTELFKVKKRLTRPVISINRYPELVIQIQGELKEIEMPVGGKKVEGQMTSVVDVLEVTTGSEAMLICNALIKSAFERAQGNLRDDGTPTYPLDGRFFALRGGDIQDGKRYRMVDVVELQPASAA